eukprot:m.1523150 g.1523150  ORF g.1523150 m.1523150 type:complete len:780 (-) comp25232_c0_seq2:3481-5820(-)
MGAFLNVWRCGRAGGRSALRCYFRRKFIYASIAIAFWNCALSFAQSELSRSERSYLNNISATRLSRDLEYLTSTPHLAGTNEGHTTAGWYFDMLKDALAPISNATVEYDNHTALLSLPVSAGLRINGKTILLEEEPYPDKDPTSNTSWNRKIWNGYGATGNLRTATAVYVNYGCLNDYTVLDENDVDVAGKIVFARYGQCFRGIKVQIAEKRGAVAVLLYSDPADYGGPEYPMGTFPDGPYLPPSGVQRGTVLYVNKCPGNPSGRAVQCDYDESDLMPGIPVLPISAQDAQPLMVSIQGQAAPPAWEGGLDANYTLGSGGVVDLDIVNNRTQATIVNIIAKIPGELDGPNDHVVVLGNHRDAWVFGAADAGSGAVTLLEVARGLAHAWVNQSWRPQRSIVLGSWDAGAFGAIGSTAFVEKDVQTRKYNVDKAAAYLNVDIAVSGNKFIAGASPALADMLVDAVEEVVAFGRQKDDGPPNIPISVQDVGPLGGGFDVAPFLNHIGIASADFGFRWPDGSFPVCHSVYDSNYWIDTFVDPVGPGTTRYLKALTRIWGLIAMRLATAPVLPMDVNQLAQSVDSYARQVQDAINIRGLNVSLVALVGAIAALDDEAAAFTRALAADTNGTLRINRILAACEQQFLVATGLPSRKWYKNTLVASALDTGYTAEVFPGIMEEVKALRVDTARQQVDVATAAVKRLTTLLKDEPAKTPATNDDMRQKKVYIPLLVCIPVLLLGSIAVVVKLSSPTCRASYLKTASVRYSAVRPVSQVGEDGIVTEM